MKERNQLPLLRILERDKSKLKREVCDAYTVAFAAIVVAIFFACIAAHLAMKVYL